MTKSSMKLLNQKKWKNLNKILQLRNHKLLFPFILSEGFQNQKKKLEFKTADSELLIFCNKHLSSYKTTYENYIKAKFGCKCCSEPVRRSKISAALKGKPKTHVSWLEGRTGECHPSYKHGLGNRRAKDFETLNKLRNWKNQVLKNYNYRCFLTRKKNTSQTPLVIHPLNSWCDNINQRFDINNGVVLLKTIHFQFHQMYGFGNNTVLQFEAFCQDTFEVTKYPWKQNNHEPIFMLQNQSDSNLQLFKKQEIELKQLCKSRSHKKIKGVYKNINSELIIFCKIHKIFFSTTYLKYKKNKFGCLKCARAKQSQVVSKSNKLRKKKI
jgi:hypothetical protein